MTTKTLDATGLRCPEPILKIATEASRMTTGDVLEVVADCPTFERDAKKWADRLKKTMVVLKKEGTQLTIQIHI